MTEEELDELESRCVWELTPEQYQSIFALARRGLASQWRDNPAPPPAPQGDGKVTCLGAWPFSTEGEEDGSMGMGNNSNATDDDVRSSALTPTPPDNVAMKLLRDLVECYEMDRYGDFAINLADIVKEAKELIAVDPDDRDRAGKETPGASTPGAEISGK